jgi:ceramide glucosyltransferase
MEAFLFALSGVACVTSIAFSLFSIRCASEFFSTRRQPPGGGEPPVSIFKSVRGADEGMYEDLASFCRLDYPAYELLFGVYDPNDPAIPLIERLRRDFPETDIRLVLCDRVSGANPKVSNLVQLEPHAKYPMFLVCDSDIRVQRDFLRRLVAPMRDASVGAVTCMCQSLSKGAVATLEALRQATEFCPNVLVASKLEGIRFGLGSATLARAEAVRKIGGFASIADYLADDYLLGNRIAAAGYRVVLSDIIVQHGLSIGSFRDLFRRQLRWNRGIRSCRPWGYRGLLFTYGIPMSLLFLAASRFSPAGWGLFGATWGIRLLAANIIGARYFNDRAARKFVLLTPLQDLLSFALWCAGLAGSGVHWRGQAFRLTREGKLVPLTRQVPYPAPAYDNAPAAVTPQ